jgi:endonuclease/exonuclease/phosphatase family metal-dependent hydrolase
LKSHFQTSRSLFRAAAFLCLAALLLFAQTSCKRSRALGPPKAVPVSTDGLELKLMSFNVRYENSGDPGSRAWRQRVIGAVKMIRDESPDVMGVQEALHGQAADLWISLPDYEFYGVGRDDGKRNGEYSGIFYRRDRFEPDRLDCGTFWLSDTPEVPGSTTWGNPIPRVAAWMRLVDRSSQRGFYVFNTHWDHRHQGSREKAARLMASRIQARKKADEPVVVLGDFNATAENPAMTYLTGSGAGLVDVFTTLHARESRRTTLHFWKGKRDGSLKVDHILVSPGAKVIDAAIRDRDEPMVSDHFPVTARVRFP